MSNWIKLSEREPETGERVLMYGYDKDLFVGELKVEVMLKFKVIVFARIPADGKRPAEELLIPYSCVSHWQPLPDAPEVDDETI